MKHTILVLVIGFFFIDCQPDRMSTPEACPLFAILLKSTDDRDIQRVTDGTVTLEQYEKNSLERKTFAVAMCYYALQDRAVNNNF